jgi:F420-dependent oxidoreductase-like protein
MRFGVFVPQGWRRDLDRIPDPIEKFEAMTTVAKVADEVGGWDSIWVYDHFHTVPQPSLEATFECWTSTATLSRDTRRVKIGQMVTCNGYRNPALLAKIASTVDVASHGRLYCGFGAGWYEQEWKAYGYEWWETPERMGHFREAVEIIHKMWTEDYPEFHGKYYHIDKPINEPKGVQKPHIPLWLGGGGEQVTLKLVARFGDGSNFGYSNPEVFKAKLDVLKRHCENEGRDISTITKSTSLAGYLLASGEDPKKIDVPNGQTREEFENNTFIGTADQFIEKIGQLQDAGVEYVICYMPNVAYDQRQVRQFAEEVIPRFA